MSFPVLTKEDIEISKMQIKQDICQITFCNKCKSQQIMWRPGCFCGSENVSHLCRTHDNRFLTEDEVCIL